MAPVVPPLPFPVGGVDYGGRRVAFCVLDTEEPPRIWTADYSRHPAYDPMMYEHMASMMDDASQSLNVGHWCVESPISGGSGNVQTALKMAMTTGALLAGAGYHSKVDLVAPSTWKKEVVGHGHSSKADVSTWLFENWPYIYRAAEQAARRPSEVQDCVDAACMAICAAARCSVEEAGGVPR